MCNVADYRNLIITSSIVSWELVGGASYIRLIWQIIILVNPYKLWYKKEMEERDMHVIHVRCGTLQIIILN